ncbi:hypothetical protein BD311DRAFT_752625 [Dichomitus squalens]|uniref:Uncharacterized protein n=1 Tax=Dichomitus squalens TaxID=114155 RepID=A0A4Q9MYN2_9APHY|nr:hypothetical protein BD311DRAFT_752625 [Dichomitus squalens]
MAVSTPNYPHQVRKACPVRLRIPEVEGRTEHVQNAVCHPKHKKCNSRFANGNALSNVSLNKLTLLYMTSCCVSPAPLLRCVPFGIQDCCWLPCSEPTKLQRQEGRTERLHQHHVDFASVNRDDSVDEEEEDKIDDSYKGWEDDVGRAYFPEENEYEELSIADDDYIAPEDEY